MKILLHEVNANYCSIWVKSLHTKLYVSTYNNFGKDEPRIKRNHCFYGEDSNTIKNMRIIKKINYRCIYAKHTYFKILRQRIFFSKQI